MKAVPLKPETLLEMNNGYCPVACPFQDGVFYDSKDKLYKIWYQAGWFDGTAYAYSEDGLKWIRQNLYIEAGTNRVLPRRDPFERDGGGVWLDHETTKPAERFKLFVYHRKHDAAQFRYAQLHPGPVVSEALPSIPRRMESIGTSVPPPALAVTTRASFTIRFEKHGFTPFEPQTITFG